MVTSLVAKSIDKWNDEPGPRFAAALAFYTAFTIVPFVVLVVMVATTFMSEEAVKGDLHQHIGDLIGEPAANGLFHLIDGWRTAGTPVLNELIALGVFLLGTVHVMDQLRGRIGLSLGTEAQTAPELYGAAAAAVRIRVRPLGHGLHPARLLDVERLAEHRDSVRVRNDGRAGVDSESPRDHHFVHHRDRALRPHL